MLRTNPKLLPILAHMYQVLIPTTRFAHIEGIFPGFGHPRWIITVVIDHATEDGVPKPNRQQTKLILRG